MHSLIEIVQKAKQYVCKGRPDFEVEEWIASCLQMKRLDLFVYHDRLLEDREIQSIKKALPSLREGVPLAYILETAYFWNSAFYITKGVLIPRPETESIVEHALEVIQKHSFSKIADVCAGSGCIGLSIKQAMPPVRVILTDFHDIPLNVMRKNALDLKLDVDIRKGSLLEPLQVGEVELVVCNPPYLSEKEWETLDRSVKQFEPKEALVGGESGLELYEQVIDQACSKAVKVLIFEVGSTQARAVSSLLQKAHASHIEIFKDLFDRERGVMAHFSR